MYLVLHNSGQSIQSINTQPKLQSCSYSGPFWKKNTQKIYIIISHFNPSSSIYLHFMQYLASSQLEFVEVEKPSQNSSSSMKKRGKGASYGAKGKKTTQSSNWTYPRLILLLKSVNPHPGLQKENPCPFTNIFLFPFFLLILNWVQFKMWNRCCLLLKLKLIEQLNPNIIHLH